ncbi:UDP-N-acetylmuramate:L-alanyl-gamma-D-glutamyl-meso-diaminopimelate ligase [Microbulbifer thermotolerans]|uniref:UDP-N-acetylmuramate--L-alanyl-gamma-D-glutamyl-meso-2,6-diaminoheptandioate ligase n=1 Tax=Microbulbifer thermotolerans TaxID=252514 RepID=A0A143HJM1_MICTH|nr:UDP-N-acetylmuramate:L-alanyl-gamma-D-glutamyl-meso-diaminopimelate ligase [Microbulbifer thermotolerans]AMX01898.1 UDP-N-acetylmuramate:L-alanyl-gamma-D-glutamyl-meso-diaminopimelate ligase [Microbulbifer thermotolerans]MCX2779200.1 UDP-N-acetylmuramate:L-alanyl-gamma-D-glutamyl-meso-diaminopimelate ligase [Microbulbifer thermotolerans]MCX2793569.1 UDP-N-acetylmuramate:L-alanyl-gamma-D-glutamyl-meso-diaminopimelate ligase [Microbulbifer thermotolerans]MCX2801561.1 UDP-N-acetylmuramate:L-ala
MHIHILGICGTFMGSLAQLAVAEGHRVTGCDANVYPPMSTQLQRAGIQLIEGYDPAQLEPAPDLVIIGNALSRGNAAVEAVLEKGLPYTSGAQWLCDHFLGGRWVLAVSGTHGKTTTSSMLAWILEQAGMQPGFLIGGVPANFGVSARLGESPFFVVEADEYDTAFFDKRSKFVHYRPRTLIINNLEFDHADIFDNLAAIQRQFHHLVRTVPGNGLIVSSTEDTVEEVLRQGCWSEVQRFATESENGVRLGDWCAVDVAADGSSFGISFRGAQVARVEWTLTGLHNVRNGLAAMAAARHVGVTPELSARALNSFKGVKRRMECLAEVGGVHVYDDFAHHPTAIESTLKGLRARVGEDRIIALIEPRSNTMRMGVHRNKLAQSCAGADLVLWYQPEGMDWSLAEVVQHSPVPAKIFDNIEAGVESAVNLAGPGTHIVVMSNGGFGGIHQRLIAELENKRGHAS